ncbi:MAG: F0F1 ATP synthase subunit B [Prevotellaceae bacterium]|jgi:F-type H+-transporting ATPase subunit b|nr:F0F1 ATP synthase subunit B [Prevotellaceae bacterium]
MSLLVPDTGLLFWMTVSFGIVFFILIKFGFPVITKAVEKRHDYIEHALEEARMAEEKTAVLHSQAQTILQDARSERNKIIDQAQDIKTKMVNEAKEEAEREARHRIERAQAEIETSKHLSIISLKDEITGISVKIAEKVLGQELEDDEKQLALIHRIMNREVVSKV